ncbi:MAG: SMI1/KNR4 family protein [Planctomycetota bacterium]
MSMQDFEAACELIRRHEELADFEGPKPDELLAKAEAAIGLSFPATYRAFLSKFGCGDIAGAEFYGIIKDNFEESGIPDAIWLTLDQRKSSELPKFYILIGDSGNGGLYAIDCSVISVAECPVVEWWAGAQDQRTVAADFGDFFLRTVREALHNRRLS